MVIDIRGSFVFWGTCLLLLSQLGCDGVRQLSRDVDFPTTSDNGSLSGDEDATLSEEETEDLDISGISDEDPVPGSCGNGVTEGSEVCDGSLISCVDLDGEKYVAGKAYCNDGCSGYDTATCEERVTTENHPDPDTVEPDPDTVEPDLDTVEPDPDTVQPDLDTVQPDPDTVQPDPDTVQPDPDTVEPDPDTAEPDLDTVQPDVDTAQPQCGNGVVETGEQCDDGLLNGAYNHCEDDCSGLGAHCGDAIKNGPEECDDANSDPCSDSCTTECLSRKTFCGNACWDAGEDCDDGNRENGDECSADCKSEMEAIYVGSGTSTQRYPLGSFFGYERSASLYTAAEIGEAGEITSIYWYVVSPCEVAVPRRVLMKQTTMTELSAVEWTALTVDATEVYNKTESFPMSNGWNGANTMLMPFKLQPGYNLLVLVEGNYGGAGSTCADTKPTVRYSTAANRHEYWNANDTPPTIVGTVSSRRPNIMLSMNNNTCVALSEPCNKQGDLSSICHDSGNSYTCTCSAGFQYLSGSCYDINECAANDPCDDLGDIDAFCRNLVGSHTCRCGEGYYFDGTSCRAPMNDMPPAVTLPYNGAAQVISVTFDTYISKVDTLIVVDRSGSMIDEHANLKTGINEVILSELGAVIPDHAFGLATFGTMEDQPYTLAQGITTDTTAMENAVDAITDVGGSSEIAYEALYQAATGEGVSYSDPGGCNNDPISFTIEPSLPGWRSHSLPLIIMCSDEPFQYYSGLHTPQQTYDALNRIHAKFIGMDSGAGSVAGDFDTLSTETRSVTDQGATFNADIPADGSGLSEAIVNAVNALIANIRYDVATEVLPVANGEGVDTTQFVEMITPVSADPGLGTGYRFRDDLFFYGVRAGTRLTYNVSLKNSFFPNLTGTTTSFSVTIRLMGDGAVYLGSRDIHISIPAGD